MHFAESDVHSDREPRDMITDQAVFLRREKLEAAF